VEKLVQSEEFAPKNTVLPINNKELAKLIKVLNKISKKLKKLRKNPH
jgi:hypothetical protein